MEIHPLTTPLLHPDDDLISALLEAIKKSPATSLRPGDILTISSKAVATCEDAVIDLASINAGNDANKYAHMTGRSAAFCQAVLDECARMNGTVRGTCPGALLTELHPAKMAGALLVPNAGLDESNTKRGTAIGWPHDPVASVRRMRDNLVRALRRSAQSSAQTTAIALLLTDSCIVPRRWGVIAFALAACGIDPLRSEIGKKDLFGKPMHVTKEAIADQLATAGNAVMGNVAQSCPAALIRDHGLLMSNFCDWVPGIRPEEDLFHGCLGATV